MERKGALLAVCFCAGLVAALAASAVTWLSGNAGLPAWAGVQLAPSWKLSWLYPRLIWGGVWGLAFFLTVPGPRYRHHWVRKGLWVSLLLSLFQLFYFFPVHTSYGLMGFELGRLTSLFILAYNLVWGFCLGVFVRILWGKR